MTEVKKQDDIIRYGEESSVMEQLLASKQGFLMPKVGDTVVGKIIGASKNEVHIDIGGVTAGVIRGPEVEDSLGTTDNIKIGDEVSAVVIDLENEMGEIELSFKQASQTKAWQKVTDLMRSGEVVQAEIMDANRGGLMVKVGRMVGFLPVSQLSPEHYPRVEGGDKGKILEILNSYVGMLMPVKVIDVDEAEQKVIVSSKDAWAEKEKDKLTKYKVGDVVEGKVSGVVDFGAFVEFGDGLEGLIHISELAWQRIDDPKTVIKKGDAVKAQVIQVEGTKISLSLKRLQNDPWLKALEKYKVGDVVKGKVLKVNPFGVFVELDKDIHGLCHVSELTSKKIADPREIVKDGDMKEFKVISVEPNDHRLGLSMKALEKAA